MSESRAPSVEVVDDAFGHRREAAWLRVRVRLSTTTPLQDRTHGRDQPGVGVGDDQLDTGQAATAQVAEELGPELLGL